MRLILGLLVVAAAAGAAERINHAGRILGPAPAVTTPLLFNTAAADAILARMQIMPRDNPWNEDISGRPVHAGSAAMITQIRSDIVAGFPSRNTLRVFPEMNFSLVPSGQALQGISFTYAPDESDYNGGSDPVAQYPIPADWPIEGWPSARDGETLSHAQTVDDGGDRHAIVVVPETGLLCETWRAQLTGGTPAWTAANGAIFHLDANTLRPAGWTSGDAAGLPMFPALIRYDECERGVIEHALRIIVKQSRREYIYPATHYASSIPASSTQYPAMGQRVRLPASFTIPVGWTKQSKAVAQALKTYGALVADNGNFFSVSACPDDRFPANCFDDVQSIDINQFEVIQTTGPSEGPRSPGVPLTANAGPDQVVTIAAGASLSASAGGSGVTTLWYAYPGAPGSVTIASPNALNTTVSFGATGTYTLMFKVSDGVHVPAYDAVVVTVTLVGGDGTPPVISAVTAGGIATTAATIGWTTDEPANSRVEYGTTAAYGSSTTLDVGLSTTHAQALFGLVPATLYHYRVRSADASGNVAYSTDRTFTTSAVSGGGGGPASGGGDGGGGCGAGVLAGMLAVLAFLVGLRRQRR